MSRGNRRLLESVGEAAGNAGSEAMAAISNFGGGDAGGTVGRLVSAVAGETGGFAPKVITSVTKHGIAGIDRVEPIAGVDRGYRAVAGDANGLESIRTIIELDPREYDVTVTREEGAGVVEFVQHAAPDPEPAVEPAPPVKPDSASETGDSPAVESATSEEAVEEAKVEARKARAEAEAEKARAEAETARAEAEAAKARARAEQTRAETEVNGQSTTERSQAQTQHDGGNVPASSTTTQSPQRAGAASTPAAAGLPPGAAQQRKGSEESTESDDTEDTDPAFGSPSVAEGWAPTEGGAGSAVEGADAGEPLQTDGPLAAETVDAGTSAGSETTVVDEEFGSFVAADPVDDTESASTPEESRISETTDEGIGNWAGTESSRESDDSGEGGGRFEF